ncbi:MAG: hypothetical protein AABZ60_11135, partial [Planctomycetota bacterium]
IGLSFVKKTRKNSNNPVLFWGRIAYALFLFSFFQNKYSFKTKIGLEKSLKTMIHLIFSNFWRIYGKKGYFFIGYWT